MRAQDSQTSRKSPRKGAKVEEDDDENLEGDIQEAQDDHEGRDQEYDEAPDEAMDEGADDEEPEHDADEYVQEA